MNDLKIKAAQAALSYIKDDMVVGIGTGSTINFLIKELAAVKHKIEGCVASSKASAALLKEYGIPVIDLNSVQELSLYIDSADEVNQEGEMVKGGGGALTGEKIIANCAKQFICIVDESKIVRRLGQFPIAVEVIPMARGLVARHLVQLGGDPEYRHGFITDNGNIILDVFNMTINTPISSENSIKLIPGVVENGIFANRTADIVLVASAGGVTPLKA